MLTLLCVEILKYWGQYLNRIFQELKFKSGKMLKLINQKTYEIKRAVTEIPDETPKKHPCKGKSNLRVI